jgi:putative ABC transport system ATP-binding protein
MNKINQFIPQNNSSSPSNHSIIQTNALSRTYTMGNVEVDALRNATFEIHAGEFVALMGSSGSGKSTLLHLLGCLDTPTSGTYLLDGQNVENLTKNEQAHLRNQKIGFIFQTFNLLARTSSIDNVSLPLLYRGKQTHIKEKALTALERVGLGNRAKHAPNELSGGERQRIAIARAIITNPSILLADEPTGNLDSTTSIEIINLLSELHQDGSTLLMVTHDPKIAKYADRIIHIQDGLVS